MVSKSLSKYCSFNENNYIQICIVIMNYSADTQIGIFI